MPAPSSGAGRSASPGLRVGDAERDEVRRLLNEHLTAGRLTAEEFGERANQAAQARTREELWTLFRDLPAPAPEFDSAPPPVSADNGVFDAAQRLQVQPLGSARINWKYAAASVVVPCAAVGAVTGLVAAVLYPAVLLLAILTVGIIYFGLMFAESLMLRNNRSVSRR